MEGERRRPITSERATLDPFEALAGDVRPREQRDLMERPFFSLAKAKRVTPILYQTGDTQVQVYAVPEHGMATIWDADVLILAASQILTAQDRGLPTSRFFQFTPYQLLIAVGRATGNRNTSSSRVRSRACSRPSSAPPSVTASTGVASSSPGSTNGRSSPRVRHQREASRFELGHLHAKSASLSRFSDFVLDIRRIVAREPLPDNALALEHHDHRRELMVMRPSLSTGAVGKLWVSPSDIGTSGARITVKSLHRQQIADA